MTYLEAIGNTPLIVADGIYVKLECANPGGSVKDRIAAFMLLEAQRRGDLKPGDTVVETTSGNTGIALSLSAASLGHKLIIFMPEHMSRERVEMMRRFGADVRLTPKDEGFAGAVRYRDAFRGKPGYYVPDQFANPDNARCHELTTGREIVDQLRALGCARLDWFVAGVGTGGTLMGVGAALRAAMPGVRLAAVEPDESAVMSGGAAGDHGIMGIGDGFVPEIVDLKAVDEVVRVSTAEAHAAAAAIRLAHGHCVGRSSGANQVAARRLHGRGAVVATVWADCADRYESVGLQGPAQDGISCSLRSSCAERTRAMLGP
ncbi:MAG TPA: cysteine synthase family protein [Planctomycetota bacterium]|nr:cysteine synthase family protein [Planctomycetota bacterium]